MQPEGVVRRVVVTVVVAAGALGVIPSGASANPVSTAASSATNSASDAAGEVIVAVAPGETATSVARDLGTTVLRTVPGRSDLVVVQAPRGDESSLARELTSEDSVRWAVPNHVARIAAVPNDPYFAFQWHLSPRAVSPGGVNWTPTFGSGVAGQGITVAVIDTGVTAHADLDNVLPGWDAVKNDNDASDEHGHGTHVAGTIAQTSGNGFGAAGIAPEARILPVRVLDAAGSGTYDRIISGIDFAVRRHAHVINLSFSGDVDGGLCDAVNRATAAGTLVVSAAGNGRGKVTYPAACANAVAVSAVTMAGTAASYTNTGPQIDIAGPGGEADEDTDGNGYPDGVLQFSTIGGVGGYYFEAGTSMASPHVAAAAALVRQVAPGISVAQVKSVLMSSAVDLGLPGIDETFGAGLVDVTAAVAAARTAAPAPAPTPNEVPPPDTTSATRAFGADRFATAANLSREVWPGGSDRAYVASGREFADALTTAGMAATTDSDGPLLLAERCDLTEATRLELQRLQPQRVTIVGGEAALCAHLAGQIAIAAPSAEVVRIAGPDRFHTAAEMSRIAFPDSASSVVVASGSGFADGLSGGALAGHGPSPLLLVGACSLPPIVASELQRLSAPSVVVLGGASAICDDVLRQIEAVTGVVPQRLAGGNRFSTATLAADNGWPGGSPITFVAGGATFPDGLAAGVAATKLGAPLLLVPTCEVPADVQAALTRLNTSRVVVVGGFLSVCNEVLNTVAASTVR